LVGGTISSGHISSRLLDPGGEGLLAHHPDRDRHVGVILAAQLGALAIIDAFPRRLEPGLVDAPGMASILMPNDGTANEWMTSRRW